VSKGALLPCSPSRQPRDANGGRASPTLRLGVETTAEGVETIEQLDLVRECGCTAVQGYYFGRPCPAADVGHAIERLNAVRRVA